MDVTEATSKPRSSIAPPRCPWWSTSGPSGAVRAGSSARCSSGPSRREPARSSWPRSTSTQTRSSPATYGIRASRPSRRSATAGRRRSSSAPSRRWPSSASSTQLVPSEADGLVAHGDEASLRRAVELEPSPCRCRRAAGSAAHAPRRQRGGAGRAARGARAASPPTASRRGSSSSRPTARRELQRGTSRRWTTVTGARARPPDRRASRVPTAPRRHPPHRGRDPRRARRRQPARRAIAPPAGRRALLRAALPQTASASCSALAAGRLQPRYAHPEQPDRSWWREPAQQLERHRTDPVGRADGFRERPRTGVGGEVVQPDLDPDRAPAPRLALQGLAQLRDQSARIGSSCSRPLTS